MDRLSLHVLMALAAGAAVMGAGVGAAHACGPPLCFAAGSLPNESATIPANATAIRVLPASGHDSAPLEPKDISVKLASTMAPVPFTLEERGLLRFGVPLEPDTALLIEAPDRCGMASTMSPVELELQVGPEAPLPQELGRLVAEAPRVEDALVVTDDGTCSTTLTASQVALNLEIDEGAAPWEPLLQYGLHVEEVDSGAIVSWHPRHGLDQRVPLGASWEGRGRDLLYIDCDAPTEHDISVSPGLPPGRYQVWMTARVLDTDIRVRSTAVEIEATCEGGLTVIGDEQVEAPDMGAMAPDAGDTPALSDDASCAAARNASPPALPAVIVLLPLVGLARRRTTAVAHR